MKECFCMGPQDGQPLCPCRMRHVQVKDGRYVEMIDHGPALSDAEDSDYSPLRVVDPDVAPLTDVLRRDIEQRYQLIHDSVVPIRKPTAAERRFDAEIIRMLDTAEIDGAQ
jgi:hypothetical protein